MILKYGYHHKLCSCKESNPCFLIPHLYSYSKMDIQLLRKVFIKKQKCNMGPKLFVNHLSAYHAYRKSFGKECVQSRPGQYSQRNQKSPTIQDWSIFCICWFILFVLGYLDFALFRLPSLVMERKLPVQAFFHKVCKAHLCICSTKSILNSVPSIPINCVKLISLAGCPS